MFTQILFNSFNRISELEPHSTPETSISSPAATKQEFERPDRRSLKPLDFSPVPDNVS